MHIPSSAGPAPVDPEPVARTLIERIDTIDRTRPGTCESWLVAYIATRFPDALTEALDVYETRHPMRRKTQEESCPTP